MLSDRENEENKNSEDKNIKKLREEFEKKQSNNENHPKTSHGIKHSVDHYNSNINSCKKTPTRYSKALSANKYNQKINKNSYIKLNGKITYDFCKKHPGYLYYKEIVNNLKNNKLNKKRTLTGKVINRNMKLEPIQKNNMGNKVKSNKIKKGEKFPKINSSYNNRINGKQTYYNNNYNYNNIKDDRNNPYSIFWANKILNQSDFKIEIKGKSYGVPKLVSANKNDDFLFKAFNKKDNENNLENSAKHSYKNVNNIQNGNKHYYNNFVGVSNQKNTKKEKMKKGVFDENKNNKNNEKCYIIKNEKNDKKEMKNIFNDDINNKNIRDNNNNNNKEAKNNEDYENEFDNESLDEEQQKQFYKNQKNFFKARKDIMEEPEYLEEDNDNNE